MASSLLPVFTQKLTVMSVSQSVSQFSQFRPKVFEITGCARKLLVINQLMMNELVGEVQQLVQRVHHVRHAALVLVHLAAVAPGPRSKFADRNVLIMAAHIRLSCFFPPDLETWRPAKLHPKLALTSGAPKKVD